MKIITNEVSNFKSSLRGMRNPLESWNKSDSTFGTTTCHYIVTNNIYSCSHGNERYADYLKQTGVIKHVTPEEIFYTYNLIGINDLKLAQKLIKAGSEHRKFMRQIQVCMDITASLYFWKELDTYKIGTTANSTSTMHKLTSKPITIDCFEIDDYNKDLIIDEDVPYSNDITIGSIIEGNKEEEGIIAFLESLRQKYLETKDKRYWKELVRWLPESWLQTRTMTMNYENLLSIVKQRQGHKLSEWNTFIEWVKTLPYADVLIFGRDIKDFDDFDNEKNL